MPSVPFSPFPLLFVFRPIANLRRKDRKGKSEAKYTVRQSSNEPRKIPHITSHHKKRGSLHSSSSANHSADSRGVEKKVRRRETRAKQPSPNISVELIRVWNYRIVFWGLEFHTDKNRTVPRFSAARRNLLTPRQIPTKFTMRSVRPQLNHT